MLSLENFSLQFKKKKEETNPKTKPFTLQNINYTLSEGESLGIVGESGSGKSLTALAILGLLPACEVSGNIWFSSTQFGKVDLLNLPEKQKKLLRGKEIGMIFQEPMSALNPVFTCGYQVEEAVRLHHPHFSQKEAKKYTLQLLEKMQMTEVEKKYQSYPHQLSGGQKQRFVIAIALAGNPKLLIADEPTTALDVTVQKEILDLLKKLQKEFQTSLLFVSHDWSVVNYIAQRVLVMYRGEKLEENTTENILKNPQHAYTKGLLACKPTLKTPDNQPLPTVEDFWENENQKVFLPRIKEIKSNKLKEQEVKNEILKIQNLDFKYNNTIKNILTNINVSLLAGETLGLVGESGSGKSTIGRLILRLEKPTKGEILFENKNIQKFNTTEAKYYTQSVQMVFQDAFASLNPKMKIGEILAEPFYIHPILQKNQVQARLHELLNLVQLPASYQDRFPHQLSGGQRQRLNIARALAFSPKILVADESTASLDVSIQAQILNLLKDLQKELSLTMLFISHDLAVIKFLADKIAILENGILVEYGEKNAIYANPMHEYTQRLLGAVLED